MQAVCTFVDIHFERRVTTDGPVGIEATAWANAKVALSKCEDVARAWRSVDANDDEKVVMIIDWKILPFSSQYFERERNHPSTLLALTPLLPYLRQPPSQFTRAPTSAPCLPATLANLELRTYLCSPSPLPSLSNNLTVLAIAPSSMVSSSLARSFIRTRTKSRTIRCASLAFWTLLRKDTRNSGHVGEIQRRATHLRHRRPGQRRRDACFAFSSAECGDARCLYGPESKEFWNAWEGRGRRRVGEEV
ncbi:hypothetical protein BU16DRAFT_166812 [Lophium mytilinum]|uniref:Uncharacterized protein n=1 Tax=Lophium mytilinum TaxID=390894 RepID=A0A6A6QCZ5_9PEZI|nr:hypothetical protein BU16DRAFT_166812 [Lophium mytilinum]